MAFDAKQPQKTITLFLEEATGVLECVLTRVEIGDRQLLGPTEWRVVSGSVDGVSSSRLKAALKARTWAGKHASVFEDGRVVYD